jgi:dolichol-phosphate mannosyltransferase
MVSENSLSGYTKTEADAIGVSPARCDNTVVSCKGDISQGLTETAKKNEFTLVIPAYNEENRIGRLLSDLDCRGIEYIFMCDGNDGTASEIKQWGALHPEIPLRCIEYPSRIGKGRAVCEGLTLAKTRFAGYMDADGSASCSQMMTLFHELNGNDGIIGSRWLTGSKITRSQGMVRQFESRIFNLTIRLLFGLPYRDTQCGAKVFRKDALDAVLPGIVSKGFEFDVELLWRLTKKSYRISEYPIEWDNRGDSRVRGPDAVTMLGNLIKLRLGRAGNGN